MKRYTYTEREVQIITSKRPLEISNEEFLALYSKAYRRDKIEDITHIGNVYPEIEDRVFSSEFMKKHDHPADYEDRYLRPIFCPADRNTEGRIRDMVCYLTSSLDWSKAMQQRLRTTVPYRLVFNYWLDEYVRDYEPAALWESFFTGQKELARILALRGIPSLDMLVYRTVDYFERYAPIDSARSAESATDREQKPRRQACSQNERSAIFFRGLG